ncbi:MAG: hypothetical protein MZV63_64360 [Marinilabiliales bacterium]|nr:hypothetical protein [Marinilabiliales bacterium]
MNTLNTGKHYFFLSGNWEQSQAPGTVMMRPVMKSAGTTTSSDDNPLENNMFMIFPNPTDGPVTLIASDDAPDDFIIEVISSTGKRLCQCRGMIILISAHWQAEHIFWSLKPTVENPSRCYA